MKIRSLTQLPPRQSQFDGGQVEVSIPDNTGKNNSYRVALSSIEQRISAQTDDKMAEKYGLTDDIGDPLNLKSINDNVDSMLSGDAEIEGVKHFTDWPWIDKPFPEDGFEKYGNNSDNIFTNVRKVKELIDNTPVYMSTTDSFVAEGNPFGSNSYFVDIGSNSPSLKGMVHSYIASGKFYGWKIDIGGNDSSKAVVDSKSQSKDGYEMMRDTGNLVAWGWVSPQTKTAIDSKYAWVALVGQLKCQMGDLVHTINVPVQVRPYILNTGMAFQYVGFNVPVRKGLRLKVMTGFPCGGESTGGNQDIGSLTFSDAWVPNSFCGYIIK